MDKITPKEKTIEENLISLLNIHREWLELNSKQISFLSGKQSKYRQVIILACLTVFILGVLQGITIYICLFKEFLSC